jgi:hypothetical protein
MLAGQSVQVSPLVKDYSLLSLVTSRFRPRSGRLKIAQHFNAGNGS